MYTEENKQIMARNIRKYMERNDVTNQQLCEDLGFKYTTFMDWIKGTTYPRIGKIEAMANYFGIQKSDLIEDKTIETHPQEMAERHAAMVMNEDMNEIYDLWLMMDEDTRKIAKGLLRSLIETKAEA